MPPDKQIKRLTRLERRLLRKVRALRLELEALERELDDEAERMIDREAKPGPENYARVARRLRDQGVDV